MGLSGLIGAGANEGLEDLLARQLLQQQQAERERAQRAQEGLQTQRLEQDASQHSDMLGLRGRELDQRDTERRDESNRFGVADMERQGKAMQAQEAAAKLEALIGEMMPQLTPAAQRKLRLVGPDKMGADEFASEGEQVAAGQRKVAQVSAEAEARARAEAKFRQPSGEDKRQWLTRNGQPVYDAYTPGDAPFDRTRQQARPVLSSDANNIADIDNSISMLDGLKESIGKTGASSALGAMMPNVVSEMTGIGSDAKQRQAMINGAKQIIGKALEGGVLRKEDEAKYERILPTIGDAPDVAASKIDALKATLQKKRETVLESLAAAGYGVEGFAGAPGKKFAIVGVK